MSNWRRLFMFSGALAASMSVVYLIHSAVLNYLGSSHLEALTGYYLLNAIFSLVTGAIILYLSQSKPEITGFSFMGISLVKFAAFFLLFYPDLSQETTVRKIQFLTFFIPYVTGMVVEVWALVRILNKEATGA